MPYSGPICTSWYDCVSGVPLDVLELCEHDSCWTIMRDGDSSAGQWFVLPDPDPALYANLKEVTVSQTEGTDMSKDNTPSSQNEPPKSFREAYSAEDRDEVVRNLASLNEIISELAMGISTGKTSDPEWSELVLTTLREHNWRLGFEFHGVRPPAEWYEKEENKLE